MSIAALTEDSSCHVRLFLPPREHVIFQDHKSHSDSSFLVISEYTWPLWVRGVVYMAGLLYLFLGIAIIADIFMCAIEKITSKTQIIKYPDPNDPTKFIDREVKM